MEGTIYTIPLKKNIALRPLRWALGMSREELAVALGVSFYTIGRWERGRSPMNKSARKHLERLLRERGIYRDRFTVSGFPEDQKNPVAKAG